ncbi:hypothetical protein QQ045_015928 [Rhodiola kirilowii]
MAMLTQTLSLERGSSGAERCLRDPSFSSYLSGGNEDCYELNLSKLSFGGLSDDEEIGVFSADKYFNEKLDDKKPAAGVIKFPPVQNDSVLSCVKPKTLQSGNTTSVSSWSSQSALLPVRNSLVNRASKLRGRRSYLGSFRCRCVCSDKNSVAVDEYQSCNEVLPTAAKEPVKRCVSTVTAESQCIMPKRETYSSSKDLSIRDLPMIPRKSLEVFGSSMYKQPYSFETERKLTINWEDGLSSSRPAEILIPTVVSGAYAESDSDASSDLFEIEDFTSKANPFLSRNMSGSATPTDAYAPSEASIEWSVVTASAADFPITSDYDELKSGKSIPYSKTASTGMNQKITATSDKPRRLSSSFLACNSQDSVKVVDHAHASPTYGKMPETKIGKSQEVPAKVFRPQTEEAKLTGFESAKNVRLGISSRSLAQSNSYHGYLQ